MAGHQHEPIVKNRGFKNECGTENNILGTKGNSVSSNKYDHSASGAIENGEYLVKTHSISYANDCYENSSVSDSNNIFTTHQKLISSDKNVTIQI
jgi:hypothetical protein